MAREYLSERFVLLISRPSGSAIRRRRRPAAKLSTYGARAFSCSGPAVWNNLPEYLRGCQWTRHTVNSSQVTSSLSRFFSLLWRVHRVTTSPCDDFTVTSYTTDVYSTLYISCRTCRCAVSVSCCCVLMAYTRKPIFGWFFRYYFMSHFKAEMHQIRFQPGLHPRPRWGSLHLQRSPRLRLRNDLYCVEWGVKLYSLTHSPRRSGFRRLYF